MSDAAFVLFLAGVAGMAWGLSVVLWGVLRLHRNNIVHRERMRVLGVIKGLPKSEIMDAIRQFDAVTYDEMLRQWWRPVGSFYRDFPRTAQP